MISPQLQAPVQQEQVVHWQIRLKKDDIPCGAERSKNKVVPN